MFTFLRGTVVKVFLFSVLSFQISSVQANAGLIPNSWINSLVLIEIQKEGSFQPLGTGFLTGSKGYRILVTNAHVLRDNKDNLPLFIRVNKKDPKPKEDMFGRIKIFPMENPKLEPVFHRVVDLAVLYVWVPNTLDLRSVKIGEILDSSLLQQKDVPLGDEVLLFGFPTSIKEIEKIEKEVNIPVIRSGIVSAKFKRSDHDLLLIDAPTYWGSSGGPVILKPSFFNVTQDPSGDVPPKSQTEPKLIGIVSEMLPIGLKFKVEDTPGTPSQRNEKEKQEVVSIWHSGLSVVVPVDYLIELINGLPRIE